jgi:polyisoprenoid-binding protein YceI
MPAPGAISGVFSVDTAASVIRWTGRNLFNHHSGTVQLAGGRLEIREGQLVSGRFDIDMTTIACEDLPDAGLRRQLIDHLMTKDFFDVPTYPLAFFAATRAVPMAGATDGTPNYRISGMFTLRGITRPLEFAAVIANKPDGVGLTAQATLDIDRTEFGSIYGSGKFFRYLGQHLVNDHIHLHLKIHAAPLA